MYSYLYTLCLGFLLLPSLVVSGTTETRDRLEEASTPTLDCSDFETFLSSGEFTLNYTATLGNECVTISTQLNFGADYTLEEVASDGTVLNGYTYQITDFQGQCALASADDDCGVQLLAFNGDNSALTLTADGGEATLTPVSENTDDWGIWQSYVILNAGLDNVFMAGGLNPDAVHPSFDGANFGALSTNGSTLILNGGEIKTYKNNAANVCGGNLQYRVYQTGDTPGSFSAVALGFNGDLGNGDQKWNTSNAGIDLLSGLTPGDYTLEIYWDADGDTYGGCGSTNYESNSGNNYTANFSVITSNVNCNPVTLDGYSYGVVEIGGQCWFSENLKTTAYADGTAISEVSDYGAWGALSEGGQCLYGNDGTNLANYGRLYNWYAVNAGNGLCPNGWHIPSDGEWTDLEDYLATQGFSGSEAAALKATSGWDSDGNGTDDYGFGALPGGARFDGSGSAAFVVAGQCGYYWSSTVDSGDPGSALRRRMDHNSSVISRSDQGLGFGFSVRCLQDVLQGCTDPNFTEYDANATAEDGSCATAVINGCTDPAYLEYDASANTDDSSCSTLIVEGCTDSNYTEYNPAANTDDSSCSTPVVSGCTDPDYAEYDASANTDDSSCATLLAVTNQTTSAKYATIQAGIDAASAGDVLSLAATTFNPTGTINVDKSLTISGAGSGSTTIDIGGYNAWGIYITADNVTLSGVTIQGDASVNEAYALKAGSGNNTGGSPSICQNLAYSDIIIQGTKRTAIDINGVNGATLTNITATGATGGFGMSISSSANVAVTNLTTSGNAWGDVGIFPANAAYQWPSLEGPTGITFDGTLDLSSGQGSISVQDGALASGGTWVGSISIDAADNADVTVPSNFDVRLDAVRSDGLAFHVVTTGGAAEPTLNALLGATSPFSYSDITLQNLLTDEWAVSAGMELQATIDAADAGDTIELDGALSASETINVNKSVNMYGGGSGTTTITTSSAGYGMSISADNVSLSGFTLDGSGTFGVKASGVSNFSLNDVEATNSGNSAIDLNGVNGATLTNISASNTTSGYGLAIASSSNVTINGITTSSNTYGAVGIFPAQTQYQDAGLEAPSNIVIGGTVSLNSGAGAITVQNGALNSGGTWVGTVSNDAADNADVTVPADFTHALYSTRNDGITGQSVAAQAVIQGLVAYGAANPVPGIEYSDVYIYDMDNGDYEVIEPLLIQDAIDAAEAGDLINVLAGTYALENEIVVNKSLTISGSSRDDVILDGSGSSDSYGFSIQSDNVTLSGMTVNGGGLGGPIVFGIHVRPDFSGFTATGMSANNCQQNGIGLTGISGDNGANTISDFVATGNGLYSIGIGSSEDVTVSNVSGGNIGLYLSSASTSQTMSNVVFQEPMTLTGGFVIEKTTTAQEITYSTSDDTDADYNANAGVVVPTDFDQAFHSSLEDVPLYGTIGDVDLVSLVTETALPFFISATTGGPYTASGLAVRDLSEGQWEVSGDLTIQDAVDIAEAGDLISVLDGTYALENEIVVNKALTISGSSRDNVILDGSGSSDSYGFSIQSDNVTLSGMTVNGGGLAGPIVFGIHVRPDFSGFTATGMSANNCQQNGIGLTGINGDNGANTISDFVATGNGLYSIGIGSSEDVTVSNVSGGNIGLYLSSASTSQTMSNVVFQEPMTLTGGFVIEKTTTAQEITYSTSDDTDADYNANAGVVVPTDFDQAFHSSLEDVPLYGSIGDVDLVSLVTETALPFFISATTGGPYTASGLAVRDLSEGRWEITNDLSIQDAIDIAESGDNIWIADDTHTITSTIDVNKGLTIEGESMAGAILDASGMTPLTNRVIETDADNITLRNLTIKPITDPDPAANNSIGFTIKAGANSTPTINDGLVMENITIDGAAERTPFDFHGLDNVTLTNLNASGTTRGNGMQFTGCTNVTLNSFTGTSNAWGGIAVYASRYVPSAGRGSDNISIVGSGLSIDGAVFSQDDIDPANGDLFNTNVSVTGWDFLVYNDAFRGSANDSEEYTFYAEDETAAVTLALGLNTGNTASSAQQISTSDWIVADGMAIASALSDATADQNVEVRAGTYEEDLAFDKQLNINGPNSGIAHDGSRGAEAIIDGEHTLSATGAVMLDGLQFLSNNPAQTSTIYITTAAGHTIQNNRFVSSIAGGGTGGQNDMALYTSVLSSGSMTITENSFSGDGTFSDGDRYSSAAWGRGLWLNGGGAAVTVSNNAFANCRSAMNLEDYYNSTCSIENNSFVDCGTGMSLGVPTAGDITTITNNGFQDVDTDINARNLTGNLNWDLDATGNGALPGNSTYYSDLGVIPGNSLGDIDDPNGNLAFLSGNGEDRLIFGGEDNTVTGDYTAAANDYLDGGGGTNYAQYGDASSDLTLTAYGDTLYVQSPTAGNDTLLNFGFLLLSDGPLAITLGCTDSGADNYDVTATVDNLTCEFQGCTNPGACNFDTTANTDDGSCEFTSCAGCRDEGACNYDPAATLDGPAGTCTYPATYYLDCDGNCLDGFDLDNNGTCDPEDVVGCMNANASNYNVFATVPDGSCAFEVVGCIQPDACNYNPDATIADVTSTCIFPSETYLNCQGACVNDADGDGVCDEIEVAGCTDSGADNYNAAATDDDGSCITSSAPGCMIPSATNYDPSVTVQGQPITSFCTFNFPTPPMVMPPGVDCADSFACNYDNTASGYSECEYSSCLGCTITSACNYDDTAIYNDGSCEYTSCTGCTTSGACNYDDTATINDGSCEYTSCAGCTEPNANNYDASATNDDGSCEYLGCTNASACNYGCTDVAACTAAGVSGPNTDDGSCEFTSCAGCQDSGACNYDATATIAGSCEFTSCAGCTDNTADNHDAGATIDDGSCAFGGCTNGSACNYDASANVDDGSCTYPASGFDCNGDCLDLNNNSICDNAETPVPGCTNPNACNYDASATQNDGSCTVVTASASDITVQLDGTGTASIVPADVDNGSGGGCTIASSSVAPNTFDVDDLGDVSALLTVTDDQGNTDTDGFTVTVQDLIPPVASANDITLAMTSTSQEVILTALQVSTSTDNAGIESQTLSKSSFVGCDDVTTHVVTLTVTDFAGNTDQVDFNVTITHPDVDSDGICDDIDNCTDLTANNYNDPANGVCQPCGTAPVFLGLSVIASASNLTQADGVVSLNITSGAPITLQLTGINGTADYSATIPTEMGTIPTGYYEARIIDADGCLGVADAPGGSTFGQPSVMYPLVMPYTQCCSGCGVYDADTDGICDDSDNCTDKTAPNYNDPANTPCAE